MIIHELHHQQSCNLLHKKSFHSNMSKRELQQLVLEKSGVSFEESTEALLLQPGIYQRIGEESGFRRLSQIFYDIVYDDHESWFLNIFASSTKQEAIENQVMTELRQSTC